MWKINSNIITKHSNSNISQSNMNGIISYSLILQYLVNLSLFYLLLQFFYTNISHIQHLMIL